MSESYVIFHFAELETEQFADLVKLICSNWYSVRATLKVKIVPLCPIPVYWVRPAGPSKRKVDMADQINCLQMYMRLEIQMQEYWTVVQIYCPLKRMFLSGT